MIAFIDDHRDAYGVDRRFRLPSGGTVCWVSRRGREVMYARGVSPQQQ